MTPTHDTVPEAEPMPVAGEPDSSAIAREPARRMTDAEYSAVVHQATLLGQLTGDADFRGALRRARQAATIAPFVHPTAFMYGGERLTAVCCLLEATIAFQKAWGEFQGVIGETQDLADQFHHLNGGRR